MSQWHTFPINDLIEHNTESEDCPCNPEIKLVEDRDGNLNTLVVHNSLDRREVFEEKKCR